MKDSVALCDPVKRFISHVRHTQGIHQTVLTDLLTVKEVKHNLAPYVVSNHAPMGSELANMASLTHTEKLIRYGEGLPDTVYVYSDCVLM